MKSMSQMQITNRSIPNTKKHWSLRVWRRVTSRVAQAAFPLRRFLPLVHASIVVIIKVFWRSTARARDKLEPSED